MCQQVETLLVSPFPEGAWEAGIDPASRIAEDSYIGQYVGLTAAPVTADDIDLISGATISSKAALSAFNIAVEAFEEVR